MFEASTYKVGIPECIIMTVLIKYIEGDSLHYAE